MTCANFGSSEGRSGCVEDAVIHPATVMLLQEGFSIEDDFGATDDFTRENDVEEEFQRARRQAEEENTRKRAEEGAPSCSEADDGPTRGPNGQQGKPLLIVNPLER